jgi:hypothetical protein
MIAQIAYTNSNCQDLWEMFITQNRRHCSMPLYMISDVKPETFGFDDAFIYQNSDPYYKVWIDAVQKFGSGYFIYLQEDFILYGDVNQEKIDEYVEFLKNNSKYSFVRLLKSGKLYNKKLSDTLYEIESTNMNVFAMQATIWRTVDYIRLMSLAKSPRWLETDVDYRSKMIALNMNGTYHYDNENKRGTVHYDSNVYPHIATALVKGKWDMSEYNVELSKLFKEYKTDINKRGII